MKIDLKTEVEQLAKKEYNKNGFFNDIEFKKDIYNLFIIRKMVNRFIKSGVINEKLLLNNVVISLNVFGINQINEIFELILTPEEFSIIKSILLFLNCYRSNSQIKLNRIIDDILSDMSSRYNLIE